MFSESWFGVNLQCSSQNPGCSGRSLCGKFLFMGGQLNKAKQNQNNNNKTEFIASLINTLSYRRLIEPSKQACVCGR